MRRYKIQVTLARTGLYLTTSRVLFHFVSSSSPSFSHPLLTPSRAKMNAMPSLPASKYYRQILLSFLYRMPLPDALQWRVRTCPSRSTPLAPFLYVPAPVCLFTQVCVHAIVYFYFRPLGSRFNWCHTQLGRNVQMCLCVCGCKGIFLSSSLNQSF